MAPSWVWIAPILLAYWQPTVQDNSDRRSLQVCQDHRYHQWIYSYVNVPVFNIKYDNIKSCEAKSTYHELESVMHAINSEIINLAPDTTAKHTTIVMNVVTELIKRMKVASWTFSNLKPEVKYHGSLMDNLKIVLPDDYDVLIVLNLPIQPTLNCSGLPDGYIRITAPLNKFDYLPETHDWVNSEGDLQHAQVRRWLQSLIEKSLPRYENGYKLLDYIVETLWSFPAYTLKITGGQITGTIKLDFIPTISFPLAELPMRFPRERYDLIQKRVTFKEQYWFAIPNGPPVCTSDISCKEISWIINFGMQEKQLLNIGYNLKPTIRLMKKLRDRQNISISSHALKTMFFMELERRDFDETFWNGNSLALVFLDMVKVLSRCLQQRFIPDLWFPSFNFMTKNKTIIQEEDFTKWSGMLQSLLQSATADSKNILDYLLTEHEKEKVLVRLQTEDIKSNKVKFHHSKLNPILEAINSEVINIEPDKTAEHTSIVMEVIDELMERMKETSKTFFDMKPKVKYQGSIFEDMKIISPDDYDVLIILNLPTKLEFNCSGLADGYTRITAPLNELGYLPEAHDWVNAEGDLYHSRFSRWLHRVVEKVLENFPGYENGYKLLGYKVTSSCYRSVYSLELNGGRIAGSIRVDLTPTMTFPLRELPKNFPRERYDSIRKKVTFKEQNWFAIPNGPLFDTHRAIFKEFSWKIDFISQNIQFLNIGYNLKSSFKLMKKLRDKQNICVRSFSIKNILLTELEKINFDESLWNSSSLPQVFLAMVEVLRRCLEQKFIPDLWFPTRNTLSEHCLKEGKFDDWTKMLDELLQTATTDPENILHYFLTEDEKKKVLAKLQRGVTWSP